MSLKGNIQQRKVAYTDFYTYKVMYKHKDKYLPYYMWHRMIYEVGKIYSQELNYHAFHSYSPEIKFRESEWDENKTIIVAYMEPNLILDIYSNRNSTFLGDTMWDEGTTPEISGKAYVVKCIIPKGSTYYENDSGEIVSNQIIITGEEMDKQRQRYSSLHERYMG